MEKELKALRMDVKTLNSELDHAWSEVDKKNAQLDDCFKEIAELKECLNAITQQCESYRYKRRGV